MCGICGFLASLAAPPVNPTMLQRMNTALVHRGPNDEGYFVHDIVGLAVRRLSIIDVAGGHQPMAGEDGTTVAVLNGEIYNFRDLRGELEGRGHRFKTKSDTEVLVHGYEEWGDDVLPRLIGMFALAIWDGRRRRLLLARDRMGEKPLYWQSSRHGLAWASELKALLRAPWIEPRVNPVALHHYLTLQYIPNPFTIFEGVQQLPAAHKLVVDECGEPVVSRWWKLAFEPKITVGERDAADRARELVGQAVERCLISDVPLGAFLSGGIDSSIVVALMSQRGSDPVQDVLDRLRRGWLLRSAVCPSGRPAFSYRPSGVHILCN